MYIVATVRYFTFTRYAGFKKWGFEALSVSENELGGYRVCKHAVVPGPGR